MELDPNFDVQLNVHVYADITQDFVTGEFSWALV